MKFKSIAKIKNPKRLLRLSKYIVVLEIKRNGYTQTRQMSCATLKQVQNVKRNLEVGEAMTVFKVSEKPVKSLYRRS